MWHPYDEEVDWRSNSCSRDGLMGKGWPKSEKWGNCAEKDFTAMYNHYIIQRGYNWCLTTNGVGNEDKGTKLKRYLII